MVKFFTTPMITFTNKYILPFYNIDFITYVPLHPRKLKEREFNQSYLLARDISNAIKIPLLRTFLRRQYYTKPQSDLSKKERRENVQGVFTFNAKYKNIIVGSQLLLIDDIITTGSTIYECMRVIEKSQAKAIALTAAGG